MQVIVARAGENTDHGKPTGP